MTICCDYPLCEEAGKYRCSRCKSASYCGLEHQKLHWKVHKLTCISGTSKNNKSSADRSETQSPERRICRCMFCGEELLLESEEKAVDHMRVCPALQEQLQSREQFTIPSIVKEKMKKDS